MKLRNWLMGKSLCMAVMIGIAMPRASAQDATPDASATAAPSETDCEVDNCDESPLLYGFADALFLARDNRTSNTTAILVQGEGGPAIGTPLQNSGDARFNMEPGISAMLGIHVDECRAWEFGYFGIFDWDASTAVTNANSLAIPGDLGLASLDYFASDRIALSYNSRLHNAEINHVWDGELVSLIAGFRYLSLDEDFILNSTDADSGASDYRIRTTNDLFGGQLGARFEGGDGDWSWSATGKAGIFGNDAFQAQSVADFPPAFFLRPETGRRSGGVAFVGDVNCTLAYQITDALSARIGYNVLFIEGVALAPDQLDFSDTPTSGQVLRRSGLFAHGANAGVGFTW
jgi:hypothetical protein